MNFSSEIIKSVEKSVLCWLATASEDSLPNVSPKEIFTCFGNDQIIIANIASPQSVKNIRQNENVCISFIDILIQKGFQLKGKARIVSSMDADFTAMEKLLLTMTEGKFPFSTISAIRIERMKPILAPRYLLFPDTTEAEQIENARRTYGF